MLNIVQQGRRTKVPLSMMCGLRALADEFDELATVRRQQPSALNPVVSGGRDKRSHKGVMSPVSVSLGVAQSA